MLGQQHNKNGSEKHIITGSSFGINTITPGTNTLSVNGATFLVVMFHVVEIRLLVMEI